MSDISTRVKKIIVEKLGVDEAEVTPEAHFTNDLGADSLDTVELIMEFEKTFEVTIEDEEADAVVGDSDDDEDFIEDTSDLGDDDDMADVVVEDDKDET